MPKKKIKVKIPSLGNFTFEGSKEEVEDFVSVLKEEKSLKNGNTIKDQIIKLISDGFFDTPKDFSDIKEELERRGFRYSSSSLYSILFRDFIRKEQIARVGTRKNYRYFSPKETIKKTLRIDEGFLKQLLNILIPIKEKIRKDLCDKDDVDTYSTLNDYFLFMTLDGLKDKDVAVNIIRVFTELGRYAEEHNNSFYVGFFLALNETLALKYRISMFPMGLISDYKRDMSRIVWEQRWEKAKNRLDLHE